LPDPDFSRLRAANSPAGPAPIMTASYLDMVTRKYQKTVGKSIAEEISIDRCYFGYAYHILTFLMGLEKNEIIGFLRTELTRDASYRAPAQGKGFTCC
jgi:hypothetical protein